jgi:hypothetical protein
MILQTASSAAASPMDALTAFVIAMVALSVAAERVTETAKQWLGSWLNKLNSAGSSAATQALAVVSGIFVVALSGQNPVNVPGFAAYKWGNLRDWASWILSGVLVAGGSAFWNHLLDILKAAKVQKEIAANALLPADAKIAP